MTANFQHAALQQRCSTPYGPFVVVHWPPQPWGVIRAAWLEDATVCRHILDEPPERCQSWLLTAATSPQALMSTRVAALQLVASLLQEAARADIRHSRELMAARRRALDDLWAILDDSEQEQPHVRLLNEQERRTRPRA
ncbi:MAG: hypothetical protein NBV65_06775 [Burkholderiaceae bacterium]|nr:hypothetical protein [Burkholderiaceae bacterium]